jgi:hypothetical protein
MLSAVRRFVDLSRPQFLALLAASPSPAAARCHDEVREGAPFRIHRDTVTRDYAVHVYAARANTVATSGLAIPGAADAIGALANTPLAQVRLAAVTGKISWALFLDPEATYVIACLGVEPSGVLLG